MENPVVRVKQGDLRGKLSKNYKNGTFYSFFGIPYAMPPIGKLRFKAPELPENWFGTRDATTERDGCISRNTYTGKIEGSEDCLFLNIYTPKIPNNKSAGLKPVIVYVHGGAFHSGSIKTEVHGPEFLMTKDVVLVTVAYRLGALGFSCLDDPSLGLTGNHGIRDVIMALKWIQMNITSFSGDPRNVTLAGESAGAVIAHHILLSKLSIGLIHKIILVSGSALCHWALGRPDSLKLLAEYLGCHSTDCSEILEFLRAQPVEVIFKAQEKIKAPISAHIARHFYPLIEDTKSVLPVLSEDPRVVISSGNYQKVPILIGYSSDEGLFFDYQLREKLKKDPEMDLVKNFEDLVPYHLGFSRGSQESKMIANKIKMFYFDGKSPKKEDLKLLFDTFSDNYFKFILQDTANRHLETSDKPVYFFRFAVDSKLNIYKKIQGVEHPGTSHSDSICYLFKMSKTPEIAEGSLEDETIKRMVTIWTDFAKSGNPNIGKCLSGLEWKPIEPNKLNYVNIGETVTTGVNPEKDKIYFWRDIYNSSFLAKL